jgi:hypothetical protein
MASAGMSEDQINSFFAQGGVGPGKDLILPPQQMEGMFGKVAYGCELIRADIIGVTAGGNFTSGFGAQAGAELLIYVDDNFKELEFGREVVFFTFDNLYQGTEDHLLSRAPGVGMDYGLGTGPVIGWMDPMEKRKWLSQGKGNISNTYEGVFHNINVGPVALAWGGPWVTLSFSFSKGMFGSHYVQTHYKRGANGKITVSPEKTIFKYGIDF